MPKKKKPKAPNPLSCKKSKAERDAAKAAKKKKAIAKKDRKLTAQPVCIGRDGDLMWLLGNAMSRRVMEAEYKMGSVNGTGSLAYECNMGCESGYQVQCKEHTLGSLCLNGSQDTGKGEDDKAEQQADQANSATPDGVDDKDDDSRPSSIDNEEPAAAMPADEHKGSEGKKRKAEDGASTDDEGRDEAPHDTEVIELGRGRLSGD